MGRISIGDKISIFLLGLMFSIMLFFVIYTALAQVFTDFLIENFDDVTNLSIIVLTLLILSFIVSIGVGLLICGDISKSVIYKSSIMSFLINFVILIFIGYLSMFILYPQVFTNIVGVQVIFIFPQIIVYFAIYVVGNIFYLYIGTQILYFIFFIIFLEKFYQFKRVKYVSPKYER